MASTCKKLTEAEISAFFGTSMSGYSSFSSSDSDFVLPALKNISDSENESDDSNAVSIVVPAAGGNHAPVFMRNIYKRNGSNFDILLYSCGRAIKTATL